MYKPSYSVNENLDLALQLIREFPLGLLIASSSGRIEINYFPFFVSQENSDIFLVGHMARANPQWKSLTQDVTISFQGPNCYISPTIYTNTNNVPTWSYAAVEIRGEVELVSHKEGIKDILHRSVAFFESENGTNWTYELPVQMQDRLESAIVGFRIKVKHIEGKFKLSQNRDSSDYSAALEHFKKSGRQRDQEIFDWMQRS